jgi:hypothetical protein
MLAFATGAAGNAVLTTDEDDGADAFRAALKTCATSSPSSWCATAKARRS